MSEIHVVITYWGGPEDGNCLGTVPLSALAKANPHFRDSTHEGGYYQWDRNTQTLRWHQTAPVPLAYLSRFFA